jgi:hypothetical protein
MANQEGIDIIIKATDQYTKTINNITASNELMGKSVKSVQKELDATTKLWTTLRVQGLDPASASMKVLKMNAEQLTFTLNSMKTAATGAGNAINGSAGGLKKSNQLYTNLALVVQDLPYGFRGIQNNLPALLGSIAGVGGAAYLAFSAIIAGFTMWDEAQRKKIAENKKLKESENEVADSINKSTASAYSEIASIKSLTEIAQNNNVSMAKRLLAVKKLQEEYPAYFGNLNKEKILSGEVKTAIDGVTVSLLARAKASAIEGKIGEMAAQDLTDSERKNTLQDENNKLVAERIKLQNIIDPGEDRKTAEYIANNYNKIVWAENRLVEIKKIKLKNDQEIDALGVKLNNSTLKQINLQYLLNGLKGESIDLDKTLLKTDKPKDVKEEKQKTYDLLAYTKTFYDAKLAYAVDDEQKQLEILNQEQLAYDGMYALKIISDIEYAKRSAEIYKQIYGIRTNLLKEQETESKKVSDRELQNSLDSLKIQSDVATKIANSSGKATSADRIAILNEYKNALYDLASIGGWTAEQFDKIDDALKRVNGAIEGSKDNLRDYEVSWTDTLNVINKAIVDFVTNSIVSLSENLGQLLAGEKVQPFVALTELLADALSQIGKALITLAVTQKLALLSLSNPLTWPVALAAGIAAVAAGAALKSSLNAKSGNSSGGTVQKFADGGIISGPTLGLMGEYPGASSNPEVVAPLDKLKDMIGSGGGGGTFVLRGQDLLLSVNRAQRASNIKGQNIILT